MREKRINVDALRRLLEKKISAKLVMHKSDYYVQKLFKMLE